MLVVDEENKSENKTTLRLCCWEKEVQLPNP